jgi:ketosteroid isomerase-like protein
MADEQTVKSFFEVFNNRDLKEMASLLDADAEFFFPKTQPLIGRERILKFLGILFRQYPQLSFTIQRVIQQGEWAAVHWTNQGFNRRKEAYQNEGVTILELQNAKIKYISDFFKNTEIF